MRWSRPASCGKKDEALLAIDEPAFFDVLQEIPPLFVEPGIVGVGIHLELSTGLVVMTFQASTGTNNLRAHDRRCTPQIQEVHITAQSYGEFLCQMKESLSRHRCARQPG